MQESSLGNSFYIITAAAAHKGKPHAASARKGWPFLRHHCENIPKNKAWYNNTWNQLKVENVQILENKRHKMDSVFDCLEYHMWTSTALKKQNKTKKRAQFKSRRLSHSQGKNETHWHMSLWKQTHRCMKTVSLALNSHSKPCKRQKQNMQSFTWI